MTKRPISDGSVHKLPPDLRKSLLASQQALIAWEDITPLARSEWICWAVSVKRPATRQDHVRRVPEELVNGKRRPCCWLGCAHRTKS